MSQHLDMPEIHSSELEGNNGLALATDRISAILTSEIPALMIRETTRDTTRFIQHAIEELGIEVAGVSDFDTKGVHYWGRPKVLGIGTKWHVGGMFFSYPNRSPYVNIRRHTAVVEDARVKARHTSPTKQKVWNDFRRDLGKPVYEAIQRPTDQVLFVEYGGEINGSLCLPTDHSFTPARRWASTRVISVSDFHLRDSADVGQAPN